MWTFIQEQIFSMKWLRDFISYKTYLEKYPEMESVKATDFCPITDGIACP